MSTDCERVRERLDDLVDGLLDARDESFVVEHLERCAACAEERRAIADLVERAAAVGPGPGPARDLWPGIRDSLRRPSAGPEARAARYRTWAWVSTAAAAVLAAVLLVTGGGRDVLPGPVVDPDPGSSASSSVLAAYDRAERDYLASRDALLRTVEARRGELDPETVAFVLDHLDRMERSAREIRAALQIEPSDDSLRRLWMASYRQRVDLLRTVGGWTASSLRPEDAS